MNKKYNNAKQMLTNALMTFTDHNNSMTEELRLRELHDLHIMDTLSESDFNDLVKLAAIVTHSESGFITFVDADRLWIKANSNATQFTANHSRVDVICDLLIQDPTQPLLVNDTVNDSRTHGFKFVKSGDIGSYLGLPIISRAGYPLGTVCCTNTSIASFSNEHVAGLHIVSRLVTSLLYKR